MASNLCDLRLELLGGGWMWAVVFYYGSHWWLIGKGGGFDGRVELHAGCGDGLVEVLIDLIVVPNLFEDIVCLLVKPERNPTTALPLIALALAPPESTT